MSHFAKIENGIVTQVIVIEQEMIDTGLWGYASSWKQTSYNTRGNVHYGLDGQPDGGIALRGNYAGIGYTYDEEHDVFYAPQPYPSWMLNQTSWLWEAPVPYPTDGKIYQWNDPATSWIEVT
jgi:hypothetical protein